MKPPTLSRRYTTALDAAEVYEPDDYSVWDLTLAGTTVTSRVVRSNSVYPDDDPPWDEVLSAKKAEVTCADFETALRRFDRRVATRLPRVAEWTESGYVVRGPTLVLAEEQRWPGPPWVRAGALVEEPLGAAASRALERFAALSKQAPTEPVRREACALLAKHCDRWVSGLLPYATLRFVDGALDAVELSRDGLHLASTTAAELGAFFDLPIAKTLRRLVLGAVGPVGVENGAYCDLVPLVEALLAKERPSLEDVTLGAPVKEAGFCLAGELDRLWEQVPNLTSFTLEAQVDDLGDVTAPRLRSLRLFGAFSTDHAERLVFGTLPSLESLQIEDAGGANIAPLWSAPGMPGLRRLDLGLSHSLRRPARLPELIALLAASTLLPQLDHLSLSVLLDDDPIRDGLLANADSRARFASLPVVTGDALRRHAASLSHLQSLAIVGLAVTPELAADLTAILPHLSFSSSSDDAASAP